MQLLPHKKYKEVPSPIRYNSFRKHFVCVCEGGDVIYEILKFKPAETSTGIITVL
jgi:hypothetical protein